MTTETSTVKWFDVKKGYGFINHPSGGDDIFVHYSHIESDEEFKALRTGQTVRFEMNEGPKGLHATDVQVTGDAHGDASPTPGGNHRSSDPSDSMTNSLRR